MKAKYVAGKGFLWKSSTRTWALTVFPISTCIVATDMQGSLNKHFYHLRHPTPARESVTDPKPTDLGITDRSPGLTSRLSANEQVKVN